MKSNWSLVDCDRAACSAALSAASQRKFPALLRFRIERADPLTKFTLLTGSASQAESDVTSSKQQTGKFLPEARTHIGVSLKYISNRECLGLESPQLIDNKGPQRS
jgi:hypothetical protein